MERWIFDKSANLVHFYMLPLQRVQPAVNKTLISKNKSRRQLKVLPGSPHGEMVFFKAPGARSHGEVDFWPRNW
jgi:hypothetical protein